MAWHSMAQHNRTGNWAKSHYRKDSILFYHLCCWLGIPRNGELPTPLTWAILGEFEEREEKTSRGSTIVGSLHEGIQIAMCSVPWAKVVERRASRAIESPAIFSVWEWNPGYNDVGQGVNSPDPITTYKDERERKTPECRYRMEKKT